MDSVSALKLIPLMHSLEAPLELPEVIITESIREAIWIPQRAPQGSRERPLSEEEPAHPELSCTPSEAQRGKRNADRLHDASIHGLRPHDLLLVEAPLRAPISPSIEPERSYAQAERILHLPIKYRYIRKSQS
jgi:hypothetical protein